MNPKLRQIKAELLADRRKLLMMGALVAVALLLWGRLLLKQVPRVATAEPTAQVAIPATAAEVVAVAQPKYPVIQIAFAPPLGRDLFALDPQDYPAAPGVGSYNVRSAKSPAQTADEPSGPAQVQQQSLNLRLASVVLGEPPRAVINDRLIQIGQEIDGFVLVAIEPRSVVVEKDNVQVRIRL
jgi:hypothetical protein